MSTEDVRYLLICVDGSPLPLLEQSKLPDNCDDEAFFRVFRSAYELARSVSRNKFSSDTPHWYRSCVRSFRWLSVRMNQCFIKLLQTLKLKWLVRSVESGIFYIPATIKFVQVSLSSGLIDGWIGRGLGKQN
jgi:hypothetical protein